MAPTFRGSSFVWAHVPDAEPFEYLCAVLLVHDARIRWFGTWAVKAFGIPMSLTDALVFLFLGHRIWRRCIETVSVQLMD